MKTLKYIFTAVLVLLFLFWSSWFYSLITLMFMALTWRKEIKSAIPYRHSFKIIMLLFFVGIFIVMPRYRYDSDDRVRLIYQDEEGNPINPPMSHYMANVLFPEEEVMNIGIWAVRLHLVKAPYVGPRIAGQFDADCREGRLPNFYRPYKKLNKGGDFMLSGLTSQLGNMYGLRHTQSVYLIRPENYDPEKAYPVVFFCHGGMGNWKLYQGLWKDLKDCIVLSVGTDDWDGLYKHSDIKKMFTRQLPFLKKMGYKVDESQLHLIGISNGGSASNVAYSAFSNKFKTITFISTGIYLTNKVKSKILFIGGGKDGSSSSMPPAYKILQRKGVSTAMFWDDDETHFIMVDKQVEALEFLNQQMFGDE